MTDDEFGEAICKKLLSIPEPEVTDEEVMRVYKAVNRKLRIHKLIKYGKILLVVVLLSGLIYWIVK